MTCVGVLCCVVLCCAVLCCVVLCCAVSCRAVLCCAVLCCGWAASEERQRAGSQDSFAEVCQRNRFGNAHPGAARALSLSIISVSFYPSYIYLSIIYLSICLSVYPSIDASVLGAEGTTYRSHFFVWFFISIHLSTYQPTYLPTRASLSYLSIHLSLSPHPAIYLPIYRRGGPSTAVCVCVFPYYLLLSFYFSLSLSLSHTRTHTRSCTPPVAHGRPAATQAHHAVFCCCFFCLLFVFFPSCNASPPR